MKKYLSTIFAACLMLIGTQAFAQLSIGAGYLNGTEYQTYKDGKPESFNTNGFYVGAGYTMHAGSIIGITPGVYYSLLSAKNAESFVANFEGNYTEHNINIPVHVSAGFNIAPDLKIFIYAGPTATIGLSSKFKITASLAGATAQGTGDRYGNNGDLKRFGLAIGGGVGADFADNFRITVGYDYGVLNRFNGNNYKINHGLLKIGVAYIL